jgi:hypothetical protein
MVEPAALDNKTHRSDRYYAPSSQTSGPQTHSPVPSAQLKFLSTLAVVAVLLLVLPANASPITLSNMPAYDWYHGCEPTSVAMIFGYWDLHGYPNLFTAQGNDVYLTANVQDEISSPAHNAKYDPTPDNTSLATPPYTSIADWLGTSVDPLGYGATYSSKGLTAFTGYAAYKGYTFTANTFVFSATWDTLVNEVNAGRPMMFLVDSDGDGLPDHAVAAFGYDDRGAGGDWYACYNTWSENETPVWYQYKTVAAGNVFGVWDSMQVIPQTPEPLTLFFLASGIPLILRRRAFS